MDQALLSLNADWRVTAIERATPLSGAGAFSHLAERLGALAYCYQIYCVTEEATWAHAVSVARTLATALGRPRVGSRSAAAPHRAGIAGQAGTAISSPSVSVTASGSRVSGPPSMTTLASRRRPPFTLRLRRPPSRVQVPQASPVEKKKLPSRPSRRAPVTAE